MQVPATRVQVIELNVPVELVVKVTVPVGTIPPAPDVSETVAVQVEATLSGTLAGEHATVVLVVLRVEAIVKVPLLVLWAPSPRYDPVIAAWPTTVGVYVTLHAPETRVQVVALKVPVLLEANETVPVGVVAPVPDVSATVAVQVEAWLSGTLAGVQTTVVEVVLFVMVKTTFVEFVVVPLVAVTVAVSV